MYKEVRKAASGTFKDVDVEKREVVPQFATYVTKDRDGDIANQGMFTKSWKEFKDVRAFRNHKKDEAVGKIKELWDDTTGAFARVKMGRDTIGNDVLLQVQDEIITDTSYLFIPIEGKYKALSGGGYSYQEVFHKEVSFLTHWGAHPESKIKAVAKSFEGITLGAEVLKELNSDEVMYLKNFIANHSAGLQSLATFANGLPADSDLYTWIHEMISSQNSNIQSFKYRLQWYGPRQKSENDELVTRLGKLKSFCHNSSASDDCIQSILKEASEIESILSGTPVRTQSSASTQEQQKGVKDEADIHLQLLNLSMQFD